MTNNHDRSVAELRRESERQRAELSQTVEALREKITETAADIRQTVSPENIKAEVSGYVAEKSRHWLETLKQQARDNPMQALAAGTAVALPVFRLAKSIPLPFLMIGAGLALTSPRVRAAVTDTVSENLKTADGGNVIDDAREMAEERWQSARDRAEGATEQARRAMHDAQSTVGNKLTEVGESAGQFAADVKDRAAEYGSAARNMMSEKMAAASETARDSFDTIRSTAGDTLNATRNSAETMVRNNAVLVGGIGVAIGALIAASLPATRVERQAMGKASDAVRDSAAEAANRTFDEAKSAALAAADSAAEKISEAALGDKVDRVAEDATEKLKTVADEAVTTAFEPSQTQR